MTMNIKIDKNVPLPTPHTSKYPFRIMEVGDSFAITDTAKNVNLVRSAASNCGKRHGVKFQVRVEEGGARVWRVK